MRIVIKNGRVVDPANKIDAVTNVYIADGRIAAVGNSGGQPDTGLYFEMRHQSRPVNPLQWVK